MRQTFRALERERVRQRGRADAARTAADAADRELAARLSAERLRFAVHVPADAFLLDVLATIDVVNPGERWLWRGQFNNKGLPTLRRVGEHSEISVVRYLARAFRVIGDDAGMLFPKPGVTTDDVNPWHRTQRGVTVPATGGNPTWRRAS